MAEWAKDRSGEAWAKENYGRNYKTTTFRAKLVARSGTLYVCRFLDVDEEDGLLTRERAEALFLPSNQRQQEPDHTAPVHPPPPQEVSLPGKGGMQDSRHRLLQVPPMRVHPHQCQQVRRAHAVGHTQPKGWEKDPSVISSTGL